jgi:hypothetical protein
MEKQNRFTFYAQTMPGVEEIAWLEIRDRLNNVSFREYLFAKEQNHWKSCFSCEQPKMFS